MTVLDRNSILSNSDIKTQDVDVPEWGGTVRVRSLSGVQRDVYGASLIGPDGKASFADYRTKLLALAIVGEDGAALFTLDDVQALGEKNSAAIDRLFKVAEQLSAMGSDAVEAASGN